MSNASIGAYRADSDRRFFTSMAIAIAITVFTGFVPTFYLKAWFDTPPLHPPIVAHGLAFSAWTILFVVQAVLIAGKRPDLPRKLGIAGALLAAAMVILGVAAAPWSIRASHTPPGIDPRSFLALPFFGITLFAGFVTAGIALRRRTETHKRLMLLALALLGLPIAYGLQDLSWWPARSTTLRRGAACIRRPSGAGSSSWSPSRCGSPCRRRRSGWRSATGPRG